MSYSLIQPLTITGVSNYSSDLQNVLNRAVQIAQIPVQMLQNQQSDVQQKQTLATSLSSAVASMASAVGSLGTLGSKKALAASSSDVGVVTATAVGTPASSNYSITNVTSVAKAASESSLQSYGATDPVSSTGTMEFTFGNPPKGYTINLGSGYTYPNTLAGLRSAINALNVGATADILTTSGGNYLSVSANSTGVNTLSLVDDPGDSPHANTAMLTSQNQGANTVFTLNGAPVSDPSTVVNSVVPGLVLSFKGTTSSNETVSISLSSDSSQLSSALQQLVSSYNALSTQVNAQVGTTAGLLSGNSIIWQVRSAMMQLVNYSGSSGSIHNLTDLGISMSSNGQMSFDSSKLSALSTTQMQDAFSFLGSATTGLGAVQKQFSQISDPVTGSIKVQLDQYTATNTRLTSQISDLTERVNTMQSNLQLQLEAADSLLASLESQQNMLTSSIQSLDYTTYGQQVLTQSSK